MEISDKAPSKTFRKSNTFIQYNEKIIGWNENRGYSGTLGNNRSFNNRLF